MRIEQSYESIIDHRKRNKMDWLESQLTVEGNNDWL